MNHNLTLSALSLLVVFAMGCGQQAATPTADNSTKPEAASASPAAESVYLLSVEPEGAAEVIQARENAKNDDDVVIVGRIGGSPNPWVEGRAAFSIVDSSLKACSDIEGDTCPMPWDYCCETAKLPMATALIKIVDQDGNMVKSDARELLKLKELQTVVVRGKAARDEAGNLTILASGVYLRK